ncbi:hypothetical protein SERLA73DRAFT_64174, partial [Serpula lacrymans var. lacrymans S7.3]
WMTDFHNVWFCSPDTIVHKILSNPDFKDKIDYAPFHETSCLATGHGLKPDKIAEDPITHGAMVVPIILGSDKTTVSIATGHNKYYPLYVSVGNMHNNVWRAHQNVVSLLGFLAIPKIMLFIMLLNSIK